MTGNGNRKMKAKRNKNGKQEWETTSRGMGNDLAGMGNDLLSRCVINARKGNRKKNMTRKMLRNASKTQKKRKTHIN